MGSSGTPADAVPSPPVPVVPAVGLPVVPAVGLPVVPAVITIGPLPPLLLSLSSPALSQPTTVPRMQTPRHNASADFMSESITCDLQPFKSRICKSIDWNRFRPKLVPVPHRYAFDGFL